MKWIAVGVLLASHGAAHAIGVDGPADATRRLGAAVGGGWDQVGGYGRDGYPYIELAAHGEALVWRRLTLGLAVTARGDFADYNFALERWRGGSAGTMARFTVGYDRPRFHLSGGPWLYGDNRDGRAFRLAFLSYGVLRMRIGSLDGWHFALRLADGAPFTAEGAGLGLRLLLGAPARGRHRMQIGPYTSIGETTAGVAVVDEVAQVLAGHTLRVGLLVGTDYFHAARPELSLFAGSVW